MKIKVITYVVFDINTPNEDVFELTSPVPETGERAAMVRRGAELKAAQAKHCTIDYIVSEVEIKSHAYMEHQERMLNALAKNQSKHD